MGKKFTVKNPDGRTYRVPLNMCSEFRTQINQYNGAYFADFINKLGQLEELELDLELVGKLAKIPRKKIEEFIRMN